MLKLLLVLLVIIALGCGKETAETQAPAPEPEQTGLDITAPKVVETFPKNGSVDVDHAPPLLKFSRKMTNSATQLDANSGTSRISVL